MRCTRGWQCYPRINADDRRAVVFGLTVAEVPQVVRWAAARRSIEAAATRRPRPAPTALRPRITRLSPRLARELLWSLSVQLEAGVIAAGGGKLSRGGPPVGNEARGIAGAAAARACPSSIQARHAGWVRPPAVLRPSSGLRSSTVLTSSAPFSRSWSAGQPRHAWRGRRHGPAIRAAGARSPPR